MSSDTVKATILNLLARREYSAQEILQKLTSRGFSSEEVKEVLSTLSEKN